MGNKQTKTTAAPAPPEQTVEKPGVTQGAEEKQRPEGSSSSPDDSPFVPAYDPAKEKEAEKPEAVTPARETTAAEKTEIPEEPHAIAEEGGMQLTASVDEVQEAEAATEASPINEATKSDVVETAETTTTTELAEAVGGNNASDVPIEKGGTEKADVPPLALGAVHEMASKPKPEAAAAAEEDDPDLMAPPPFLTDAIGSFKFTKEEEDQLHPRRSDDLAESDSVTMTAPVISFQLSMDTPAPVTEVDSERDDVSIEEEVVAADGHPVKTESKGAVAAATDELVLSSSLPKRSEIPEDVMSLSSSVAARGDEEMMKNIMGTSVQMPDATSNESIRGSVAISELTYDDPGWDSMRISGSGPWKQFAFVPLLVEVALVVAKDDSSIEVQFFYEEEQPRVEPIPEATADLEVTGVVQSIFETVIQKVEASYPETETSVAKDAADCPREVPEVKQEERELKETAVDLTPTEETPSVPLAESAVEPEEKLPQSVEGKCVTVGLEDTEGEVKVSFEVEDGASWPGLEAGDSVVSSSLDLKTPFDSVPPSVDSGEQKEGAEDLAEAIEEEPLETSLSEGQKRPTKSRSRRKKGKTGQGARTPSPGLSSSLSDGSTAADRTSANAAPKGMPAGGRSVSGQGSRKGRQAKSGSGSR